MDNPAASNILNSFSNTSDYDIVDSTSDFPRLNKPDLETKYFTHSSIDNIFKASDIRIDDALKSLHINIRGLETHFDDLLSYLLTFSFRFDIICISEAHLDTSKSYLDSVRFDIDGYCQYQVPSTIQYGGCVIYVRQPIKSSIIPDLSGSNSVCDTLYVNIDLPGSKKPCCIGLYYRHNKRGKDIMSTFIEHLDDHLGSPLIKNKRVIVMGDMNIDLARLSTNPDIELYVNTFICHEFESHINSPTRIQYKPNSMTLHSATIIDHIFSNLVEFDCIAGNITYPDSDHFGNFLIVPNMLSPPVRNPDKSPIFKRNYSNINIDSLQSDFQCIDWTSTVLNDNVSLDNCVTNLINNITDLCDKHAPLKRVPDRKIKYINRPWITKDILPHIIYKNKLAKTRHTDPDSFKPARNFVNNLVNKSKHDYLHRYFSEHKRNSKKIWEGIRTAIDWRKSKSSAINSVKDTNGNTITNPKLMAESFAKYFNNIPHKCVSKIPKGLGRPSPRKYLPASNSSSMVLLDTDSTEIYNIISGLNINKSPGPLQFSNYFIKILNDSLAPILSSLINRSFKESSMPGCLKVGKQTPVFKAGDNIISNYRPITVVNSIAKIFEKAVCSRLVLFLKKFNIIINNQFGFRERHSTNHAAVKVLDEVLLGLDNRDFMTGAVFLDISKAFDCVDHSLLLDKLSHYGIRGNVQQWFKSFLTDREHFVELNGVKSKSYCPTIGVPQGSVLGPILFIIFINDLSFSSKCFSFSIFADDTSIILKIDKLVYRELLVSELSKVMDWFSINLLLLNYNKSQYLYFGPHYPDQYESTFILSELYEVCPQYLFKEYIETDYGILIEQNEVRYLGIIFDNNLQFSTHISQISMKISKVVGILWKASSLPINIKLNIYYSLIFTHLNYAILVWGNSIAGNLTRGITGLEHVPKALKNLNTIHNKAIRALVCARKQDPLSSIYRDFNILKLVDLYYLNLGIFVYESFTCKAPDYFNNYIESLSPPHATRLTQSDYFDFKSDKVYYNQPNLKKTLTSVKFAGSALWNKLPKDIKNSTSLCCFKKRLRDWLSSDYISSREVRPPSDSD